MAVTTTNLVAEWVGKLANGGTGPGLNSPATTTWDAIVGGATYDGAISGVTFDGSTEGWVGDGSSSNPYGLKLNGTDAKVQITGDPMGFSDGSWSWEIWVKTAWDTGLQTLLSTTGGTNSYTALYVYSSGNMYADIADESSNYFNHALGTYSNTTWAHYVMTSAEKGSTVTIYKNGSQYGSTQTCPSGTLTATGWAFGSGGTSFWAKCTIYTVRLYSAALTSQQVSDNYNAGVTAASVDGSGTPTADKTILFSRGLPYA